MKKKEPRRRKAAAAEAAPPAPSPNPQSPALPVEVHRTPVPAAPPLLVQVVETLRLVAERMIDIADAAAEAVTKRLAGRA